MKSSFANVFKKRKSISQMQNKIQELTLMNASDLSIWFQKYRTNLTNFMNYKRDSFSKEISNEFNQTITNYINQSLNVKFIKNAVNLIEFDMTNDWYNDLIDQNVHPSNIGIVCECLYEDKNIYLLENSKNKLKTLDSILSKTVAYSLAIMMGQEKTLDDFNKILNNQKIFEYFKKINKEVYKKFGNFKENVKTIIKTEPNHYIGVFEIDFLTDKNYLIDIKCSKNEFKPSWIKQLFVYALCVKKYMNIKTNKIIVLNPITNKNYFLNLEEFLDYDFWIEWCDKNFIF